MIVIFVFALAACSTAPAALILSQNDGATPVAYSNGGGSGFGGGFLGSPTVRFTFDLDGSNNIVIGYSPDNAVTDPNRVVLYLDTRSGGFTDATMSDTADDGRRAITELGSFGDEVFPSSPSVVPDFAIAYRQGGCEIFELTSGSLNFLSSGSFSSPSCTITVPYATLGSPAAIDFFAALVNASNGFLSSESHPASAGLNG
ncbi:MAG TPA: hypothetical protein VIY86_00115, partial [Pirellulaceae bacterium]